MKFFATLALIALVAPACRAEPVTLATLLTEMTDRDALARWPEPAYVCKQESSTDRASVAPDKPGWFGNRDAGNFLGADFHRGRTEYVMLDASGPGAVVNLHQGSADPEATVRVYLDYSDRPVIEENLRHLLGGAAATEQESNLAQRRVPKHSANEKKFLGGFGTIKPPLAGVQSLGCNFYLPIPYAKHCKITYDKPGRCFFRINYRRYAEGTKVETFTLPILKSAAPLIEKIGTTLLRPEPADIFKRPTQKLLQPGESLTVKLNKGPSALRQLSVKLRAENMPQALRSTVLKFTFDGEQTVWCPVGDFFASGVGIHARRGWNSSVEPDGTLRCFWVMPFKNSCKIELQNLGAQPVEAALEIGIGAWKWDERSMHFHTGWRQQTKIQTKPGDGTLDWNFLEVTGRGVYVGDTLTVRNGDASWWGEGDEKIYLDGERFPSHFGTGTDDYYGFSLGGPASAIFDAPFIAHPQIEGDKQPGFSMLTRQRSLDAIPFKERLKFDLEIWHTGATNMDYAATTHWYALPGAVSNRVPMVEEVGRGFGE